MARAVGSAPSERLLAPLREALAGYAAHHDELLREARGRVALLDGAHVVATFADPASALAAARAAGLRNFTLVPVDETLPPERVSFFGDPSPPT